MKSLAAFLTGVALACAFALALGACCDAVPAPTATPVEGTP